MKRGRVLPIRSMYLYVSEAQFLTPMFTPFGIKSVGEIVVLGVIDAVEIIVYHRACIAALSHVSLLGSFTLGLLE